MKEVFPTEYWPISSTIGLESNHASPSTGSRRRWYIPLRSRGRSFSAYSSRSVCRMLSSVSWPMAEPKPRMDSAATNDGVVRPVSRRRSLARRRASQIHQVRGQ